MILGLTLEAAKALGTRLEQNAIVWAGGDAGLPQADLAAMKSRAGQPTLVNDRGI